MKSAKPLLIEFVGTAGSGKSYICEKALQHLRESFRVELVNRKRMSNKNSPKFTKHFFFLPKYCLQALSFIGLFLPTYRFLKSLRISKNKSHLLKYFLNWIVCQQKIGVSLKQNADILLLDQGPVQLIHSYAFNHKEAGSLEDVCSNSFKNFYMPNMVIFVKTNPAFLIDNWIKRDNVRLNHENVINRLPVDIKNYSTNLLKLSSIISDFDYIVVENSKRDDISDVLIQILTKIYGAVNENKTNKK